MTKCLNDSIHVTFGRILAIHAGIECARPHRDADANKRGAAVMTRSTLPLSAAVLFVLVNGGAQAQQKPDFNGTWTMDMSRSESAAQGTDVSPRTPVKLIVRQSPADFNVETNRDGTSERLRFVFGQSEPASAAGTGGRRDAIEPAGVEWRGGDL